MRATAVVSEHLVSLLLYLTEQNWGALCVEIHATVGVHPFFLLRVFT